VLAGFRSLFQNVISMAGAALATIGAGLFLLVFLIDLFGYHQHPYIGIIFFLLLPAVFVFGLMLIPVGIWFERRRRNAGRAPSALHWPRIDLDNPRHRTATFAVIVLTLANVIIISAATYRGIEYMDSVEFCGQVCHGVMQPEFTAYQDGAHSRVACVQCHIGSGAQSFVRAKLSGTRQVYAVLLSSHERPIPSPVETLRPARDTCEQCHWPEKFHGDKTRVIREFGEDEQNTETATTLQVHVGGGSEKLGLATGIHWHMNVANHIEYIATDDKRQVIPYVFLRDRHGRTKEYIAEGVTKAELEGGERRTMDCMDCHNRPSHTFAASAERAVDEAMAIGEISIELPFVKREAVAALKQDYPDQQAADDAVARRLHEFYRTNYPAIYGTRRQVVERAVTAAQRLYRRNVFPAMRIGWGTYPNNIGHVAFPGCFRCHDEEHKASDGSTIRQDCELCHAMP
jgi:nitrate/TMAO reductase-like tetraheme cytochrome c subunit